MGSSGPVKSKFQNTSRGVAGAVILTHEGKPRGIPVAPKAEVWLSIEEQALTANAPRNAHDNPFTDGTFTLIAKGEDLVHERPIGDDQEPTPVAEPDPDPADDKDPENIDIREESLEPADDQPPAVPEPEPESEEEKPPPPMTTQPSPAEPPVGVNPVEGEDGTVEVDQPPVPKPAPKPLPPKPPGK